MRVHVAHANLTTSLDKIYYQFGSVEIQTSLIQRRLAFIKLIMHRSDCVNFAYKSADIVLYYIGFPLIFVHLLSVH